jgi:Bacterial regulatory proteins, luxR family
VRSGQHLQSHGGPLEEGTVDDGCVTFPWHRRLFIAPGTVKVHMSHIFGKLGTTTRAELAAQAASQDLTAS